MRLGRNSWRILGTKELSTQQQFVERGVILTRPMIDPKITDEIFAAVARFLPRTPADLERNVKLALATVFDRLDLVTREELDVQEAVLQRTRARLKEMEERVAALEQRTAKE